MPAHFSKDRSASSSDPLENGVFAGDEVVRQVFANAGYDFLEVATDRIGVLDTEIAELDRKVQQLRASKRVTKRVYPGLKTWLLYLLAVVVVVLVLSSLLLHMSELFGWGLHDWVNGMLDNVEATLSAAGSKGGLIGILANIVLFLIAIIVTVLISLPLGILHMLQVILPDAESYMGFLEGAVVVAAAIVLARLFPLVGEDVTYKTVYKKLPAAKERELEELEQELREKKEKRENLFRILFGERAG